MGGPIGAVIGIMKFGDATFGPNPPDWPAQAAGTVGSFTTATQIRKGEMNVSTHFHVWSQEEAMQTTPHIITPADKKIFVVFDSATGEIQHVHTVLTFSGAEPASVEAQEARAMDYAGQFGRAADRKMQVLRADTFQTHISHRVDLKTLRLINDGQAIGRD